MPRVNGERERERSEGLPCEGNGEIGKCSGTELEKRWGVAFFATVCFAGGGWVGGDKVDYK